MSYKEKLMKTTGSYRVKPEPQDVTMIPSYKSEVNAANMRIKAEPSDAARVFIDRGLPVPSFLPVSNTPVVESATAQPHIGSKHDEDITMKDTSYQEPTLEKPTLYTMYHSPSEIQYQPEEALTEGLGMVKAIKTRLKTLQLGSKLRQDVWLRELESLQSQGAPTTLIAVCGATGAGKSSILNAILDDNIVPTSGMRACTAVVTELAYHNASTIDADVSFLSEAEWKEELGVLLHDLVDEDGNIKRSTDLKSDAGVAWQKVHAVYPSISQEQLVEMSVEQIIARDSNIARILGTTKHIKAKDSKTFASEIGKYIDSKDQKRGDKKKGKGKKKGTMEQIKDIVYGKSTHEKADNASALWPLIRQVNVRCSAKALSTGAVLVDLPGVADANAARNNIAKDYMKKCDCIWILAPITRAVDDKTARDLLGDAFKMQLMMDGNYDDHAITFIASKCDDVSCSEVIRALSLEDDPELEEIENRIDQNNQEISEWKRTKLASERSNKGIDAELKAIRERLREYEDHLKALKNNEPFVPRLTGKSSKESNGKKRKNTRRGKKSSPKRRRGGSVEDDHDSIESDSDEDSESNDSDSDVEKGSDEGSESEDSDSDSEGLDDTANDETEEEVTEESLTEKIAQSKEAIKSARLRLSEGRKQKKEAADYISTLKKNVAKAQKEKNAFCSLKRSEFSRDVLKEDFRVGLKDLDDAAAEERDPDGFNPNVNIRNYDEIDLPVFTCSSRDYVRLKRQVKGDGEPTCFSNAKDTGIPELQDWCHQLTISSRERAAKNFLSHLKAFATSVQSYVQGIGDVTMTDREALREKWESSTPYDVGDEHSDDEFGHGWADSDAPSDHLDVILGGLGGLGGDLERGLYSMDKPVQKVDEYGQPTGITPRLVSEFRKMVDSSVHDLQEHFRDGLEDKCKVGAANAAGAAVTTSDEFAGSMHWATYRATLRRHGSWRRDLNVELITPFTRNIAHSWSKVFESDMFAPFESAAMKSINKLLKDVEESAAHGLKDHAKLQAENCLDEARVALTKTMDIVKETLNNQQKEVSRCMAPHVQAQLVEGYNRAMEERGTGSVARQKAYFHEYMKACKDEIFDDGADVVMDRLTKAAEAIGEALDEALGQLAQKMEVSLAVLWEGARDDPAQVRARNDVVDVIASILTQVKFWIEAEQLKRDVDAEWDTAMRSES